MLANFATLGLGILATITGSGTVLAVFVVATAALMVAALYVQARSGQSSTEVDATSKEPLQ